MTRANYEIIDHTADWALRVSGRNLRELLYHAATGMNSLMVAELTAVPLTHTQQVALTAYDAESLLVVWLSELAYFAEMEQLIFPFIELQEVSAQSVTAVLRGGRAPELQKHIKAVTYHNLQISQTEQGLEVTIVFDV